MKQTTFCVNFMGQIQAVAKLIWAVVIVIPTVALLIQNWFNTVCFASLHSSICHKRGINHIIRDWLLITGSRGCYVQHGRCVGFIVLFYSMFISVEDHARKYGFHTTTA